MRITGSFHPFLYDIGERSLPDAFVRIVRRLRTEDHKHLLSSQNSVFMLEALLQRHVYTRPLELKRDHSLRDSILELLDIKAPRRRFACVMILLLHWHCDGIDDESIFLVTSSSYKEWWPRIRVQHDIFLRAG